MTKASEIMERFDAVDVDRIFIDFSSMPLEAFETIVIAILGDYEIRLTSYQKDIENVRDTLRDAFAELEARAMPEGFEWPLYEDGEPVRIWDTVPFDNGSRMTLHGVELSSGCFILHGELPDGKSCQSVYPRGERVKRHSVIAADGEPLEVGQTVYATYYDYAKCTVLSFEWMCDGWLVEVENEGGHKFRQTPDEFTHQRTVLDADGVPIKKGDTVWHIKTGREYVVVEPSYGETVVVRLAKYDDAEGEQYAPDQLTHTKPEIDSWERVEDDARWMDSGADCGMFTYTHEDIVRRCRALAEKENRNE